MPRRPGSTTRGATTTNSAQNDSPQGHPWWQHVPEERRPTLNRSLRRLRRGEWMRRRRSRILVMVMLYALLCALPILFGGAGLSLLAVLPMLLLPALGLLTWWLTWKEFHH